VIRDWLLRRLDDYYRCTTSNRFTWTTWQLARHWYLHKLADW